MQTSMTRKWLVNFFLLSLLLHLLFISLTFLKFPQMIPKEQKHPNMYVPSYLYKGAIKPSYRPDQAVNHQQESVKTVAKASKPSVQAATPLPKVLPRVPKEAISVAKNERPLPSLMASSLSVMQNTQMQELARPRDTAEPILLVGDEHEIADPFVQLIGRALSANFHYPELEGRMGIKGRVLVEMTLHPEGYFDDVVIVKSSNNEHFDAAALYAINKAPAIEGADRFIQKPKRFVVGFVFL